MAIFIPRQLPGTEQGGIQQQFDDEHQKQLAALALLSCMLRHTHHFKHGHIDQRAPTLSLEKNIHISPEGRKPNLSWQQLPNSQAHFRRNQAEPKPALQSGRGITGAIGVTQSLHLLVTYLRQGPAKSVLESHLCLGSCTHQAMHA